MASPSELTLDYKPNTNTTSYTLIQKSTFGDQPESTSRIKLEDFLARLEEERHKIEAFKRELPLCMQLLNNAMETYRRQLETYQNSNSNLGPRPVFEEFIPLSNMSVNCSDKLATSTSEKANWMVSAQLWSLATATEPTNTKLALDNKQRNGGGGGAFLPFSKEKTGSNKGFGPGLQALPELALATSVEEEVEEKKCEVGSNGGVIVSKGVVGGASESKGGSNGNEGKAAAAAGGAGGQSTHRKARRCWSPDLHRRFVNALQTLGGSQVATPKQIRELMKVDGLTNDEVKSHLQKYRLHTRRPIQPPQPPGTAGPQLVVLGGIWIPPEYANAAATAGGPTIYPAPPTAAHYPVAHHEFYAAPPPPGAHPHLHRASAVAGPYGRARVVAAHSPESELRSSRDWSESIEDGEEGEEREEDDEPEMQEEEEMEEVKAEDKALVPVEGDGNVGDMALKF